MKVKSELTPSLSWCVTPIIASAVFLPLPSIAATLASSEARVEIGNFSHNPIDVQAITNTNTQTIATNGQVTANANAEAVFPIIPLCQKHQLSTNLSAKLKVMVLTIWDWLKAMLH